MAPDSLPLPLFLASIAARTLIVLVVLVAGIRLFGKRGIGDMNLVDILMILLVGNAVQNALTQGSGNLAVGIVSAAALLLADRVMGRLFVLHPRLEKVVEGEPVVLFSDGVIDEMALEREGVSRDEVMEAVREMGLSDINQVRIAILETNGSISVIPKDNKRG